MIIKIIIIIIVVIIIMIIIIIIIIIIIVIKKSKILLEYGYYVNHPLRSYFSYKASNTKFLKSEVPLII